MQLMIITLASLIFKCQRTFYGGRKHTKWTSLSPTKLQSNLPVRTPLGTDTSLIQTPQYYEQFPMSRQNPTFSLKKNLSYNTDSL